MPKSLIILKLKLKKRNDDYIFGKRSLEMPLSSGQNVFLDSNFKIFKSKQTNLKIILTSKAFDSIRTSYIT